MSKGRPGDPVDGDAYTPGRPTDSYAVDPALDHERQVDAYEGHLDELEAELPALEEALERIAKRKLQAEEE